MVAHFLVSLPLQEEESREDVDVGIHDERLHGQLDAGKDPAVFQDVPTDRLVSGARVGEDAVRQDDAHATTGLDPLDGALDEQLLGRHAARPTCNARLEFARLLVPPPRPGDALTERTEHRLVADGDVRAKRGVGQEHVHGLAERNRLLRRLDARQVPSGEGERVHVEDVPGGLRERHDVHGGRPDQRGVEVRAEEVLVRVHLQPVSETLALLVGVREAVSVLCLLPGVVQVVEGRLKEPAGAAGGVEYGLVLLRVEDLHHQVHRAARREVLAPVAPQVGADQLLVGDALGVDVGATEVVRGEFADDEGERPVGEGDLVRGLEDTIVFALDVFEEFLDTRADGGPPALLEHLLQARAKAAASGTAANPLVVRLGEKEVEELPEGGILRHALVAMDVVVATTERGLEHLRLGPAQPLVRCDGPTADGAVGNLPVAAVLEGSAEASDHLLEEEEVDAVRPHAIRARGAVLVAQQLLELVEVLLCVLGFTELDNVLAALGLGLADHHAPKVRRGVRGAGLEDRDVRLLRPLARSILGTDGDREITRHVMRVDPVLVDEGPRDALADLLLRGLLDRLTSDVVDDLAFFEGGDLGLGVLRRRVGLAPGLLRDVQVQGQFLHQRATSSLCSVVRGGTHRPVRDVPTPSRSSLRSYGHVGRSGGDS